MSAAGADDRPRPRPRPVTKPTAAPPPRRRGKKSSRSAVTIAARDAQTQQAVAVAGTAIVTAARVGRLLGRSGWRIARQIPAVAAAEQQVNRLRQQATDELRRLLAEPQPGIGVATDEEQRAMAFVRNAATDPAPLRSAMTELLDRAGSSDDTRSRDYLFGTIVSQLVPDEARILAALAGRPFAAVDVLARVSRTSSRTVLANASTVGFAAGVTLPQNVSTYLTRLHGYGLVEFGGIDGVPDGQFDSLERDPGVVAARRRVETGRGTPRLERKSVGLSALGREFWTACSPTARR